MEKFFELDLKKFEKIRYLCIENIQQSHKKNYILQC